MPGISGNHELGRPGEEPGLNSVYEYLSGLILDGYRVGNDGNIREWPDATGSSAEKPTPKDPPENEGAEAALPPAINSARWAGNIAMSRGL